MHRPTTDRVTERNRPHRAYTRYAAVVVVSALALTGLSQTATAIWFNRTNDTSAAHATTRSVTTEKNSQTLTLPRPARNIDPNPSRGGGDVTTVDSTALIADGGLASAMGHDQAAPPSSDQISLYMVQEGDTLSQVAEMFSVSVNTIVWANQLSGSTDIHPGETLLILPISGIQHTVEKGETLQSIAKKYGGDADEMRAYNGLTPESVLAVGTTVTIPGGEMSAPKHSTHSSSGSSLTEPLRPTKIVANTSAVSGYFINPLPGGIKTQGLHGYNAVDIGAPVGTPIRAAAAGRVIVARVGGWNGGYGSYVVIDHPNGTQTLYAHQSKVVVWQGQSVVQGQVIGYVGSTGKSTGPHLHFEVRGGVNPF